MEVKNIMFKKFKSWFSNIVTTIKNKFNWKKIKKISMVTASIITFGFMIFFGVKYKRCKWNLDVYKMLFHDVQNELSAVSAQATQLMNDNIILSELCGMVLGVPGDIYA